ncbi:Homeobox-leucine zipper protein PROTODERMAL FACTOR 2 [Castilleja foliolosa]|uniref:Homeobox-leucine zipper protein PROTODERMAL FACTOR 2 n=1 Tax=Castilleja foliolosa TaxID=1961234 RepID=A0ABD3D101_9LAMI
MSSNTSGDDVKPEVEPVEVSPPKNNPKRKRCRHRHTPEQIQAMEEYFKDCPHPDIKQRTELSEDIGIDPFQVKFWFQNKRTQMKTNHERQLNTILRTENEKLRAENLRFKEALSNSSCPACGCMAVIGDVPLDERHLRMENARLRNEINRISGVVANYVGKPLTKAAATPSSCVMRTTNLSTSPMFRGSSSKGNGTQDSDEEHEHNEK